MGLSPITVAKKLKAPVAQLAEAMVLNTIQVQVRVLVGVLNID